MSAAAQVRLDREESRRLLACLVINAAFPTLFMWFERVMFHTDLRGYLDFAHSLARIGFLPPDTLLREWSLWEDTYQNARVGANFGYEANPYIVFIIPMIFLAHYLWRRAESSGERFGYGALALFLLSGLLISLSRTAVVTLAACILIFAPGRLKLLAAAGGTLLVVALIALFPDNYFIQRYTMQSADSYSFAAKFYQIARGLQSAFSNPLSLIFGEPALVMKHLGGFNPHNQFIYDLMSKGLLSFAAGLGMFMAFFRRAVSAVTEAGEDPRYLYAVKMGLASVFITCLSTHVMINSNTSVSLWILVFLLLQAGGEKRLYVVKA